MKKTFFPDFFLSFTCAAFVVITLVGLGYFFATKLQSKKTEVATVPHIYYSASTITSIDAQGNSTGNETVYRVDGMDGQPTKVVDLPSNSSSAHWLPSTISYDVWSGGGVAEKVFSFAVDNDGREVWSLNQRLGTRFGNDAGGVIHQFQWVHPAGTYVAVSEIYCTDAPKEGPCAQSFRLVVTDLRDGSQRTYSSKTFEVEDGAWVIRVISVPSPTTGVIQISGSQEPSTSFIGILDFSTGLVNRRLYDGVKPIYEYAPYQFLRVSDDKKSLYFAKTFLAENENKEISAIDIQTGLVSNIISVPRMTEYSWPEGSTSLYYKPTDDRIIKHDVVTGKESTILWNKPIADYLDQKRFVTEQSNSSTGVYGGKLIVVDMATGKQRVIYDQLHDENAYGPNINGGSVSNNAVVGDKVYRFLGMEQ